MTSSQTAITTNKSQRLAVIIPAMGDAIVASIGADKSQATRRSLAGSWARFADFIASRPGYVSDDARAVMGAWRDALAFDGLAPASINAHITNGRAFWRELAERGVVNGRAVERAASVKRVTQRGVRVGNWLSPDDAQRMIDTPNATTTSGKRDKALLALAVVCGLRRSELAALRVGHLQTRDGHHIIADLLGKHGRVRTVVIPDSVFAILSDWLRARGPLASDAPLFVPVDKAGRIVERAITSQTVYNIVRDYGAAIGHPELAAHDTRRTAAQLARRGGASLEVIGQMLGHARLDTTQRYLGTGLDLAHAASDAGASLLRL